MPIPVGIQRTEKYKCLQTAPQQQYVGLQYVIVVVNSYVYVWGLVATIYRPILSGLIEYITTAAYDNESVGGTTGTHHSYFSLR